MTSNVSLSHSLNEYNKLSSTSNHFNTFKDIDFDKEDNIDYNKLYDSFHFIAKFISRIDHPGANDSSHIDIATLKYYLTNFGNKMPANLCDSFLNPLENHTTCNFDDLVYLLNYNF